jgi:DNA repair exonuclease SbcCD ATPase subunit
MMPVDPSTGLTLVKIVSEASKKLYELTKTIKDREIRQKLDEMLDELRDLKHKASELEDENRDLKDQNRELREKLRFKSEEFEFRTPFWYEKSHPDRPLCAMCFAKQVVAPMSEPYRASGVRRRCLVCGQAIELEHYVEQPRNLVVRGGEHSWMG